MAKTCGELFEGYDCTILGDGAEPVRGLARCYGRALARWRLEDADASAPQFMHTLTEAEAERDAVGAYRRFWARKRRLKRLLRRC